MKDTTTKVLGFDVPVTGQPTTLEECITAAGGEDKLVEGWIDYITYHKTNTAARSAVTDAIEEVLNIKRETKKETTAAGKEIEKFAESEQTYADRAIAQYGKTRAETWDLIKETVGSIPFSAESRGGGVGRLAKQDTTRAQTLIDAGAEKWQLAVTKLESTNPGLKIEIVDGKPTVESLATALRTNRRRLEAEENASLGIAA